MDAMDPESQDWQKSQEESTQWSISCFSELIRALEVSFLNNILFFRFYLNITTSNKTYQIALKP
jgi:hypothetical protein